MGRLDAGLVGHDDHEQPDAAACQPLAELRCQRGPEAGRFGALPVDCQFVGQEQPVPAAGAHPRAQVAGQVPQEAVFDAAEVAAQHEMLVEQPGEAPGRFPAQYFLRVGQGCPILGRYGEQRHAGGCQTRQQKGIKCEEGNPGQVISAGRHVSPGQNWKYRNGGDCWPVRTISAYEKASAGQPALHCRLPKIDQPVWAIRVAGYTMQTMPMTNEA